MQTFEYLIKADGSIARRDISESELELTETIVSSMCAKWPRKVLYVFTVDDLPCHLCTANDMAYYTLTLPGLQILASYKAVNKILVPSFNNPQDPKMTLLWVPPIGTQAKMLISINKTSEFRTAHLFLYDSKGSAYRMPLPNLYDDCRICLGEFDWSSPSHAGICHKVLRQFHSAPWNSDLLKSMEVSQNFFRWQPVDKQFEVLPPNGEWQNLCAKVSIPVMEFVL